MPGIAVGVQAAAVSGQHVYIESGVHVLVSGQLCVNSGTYVASGVNVQISGSFVAELGIDYIKSGTFPACSGTHGQLETPTVMKDLEPAHPISGWWACAEEARLFVGSDAKHIRFHDNFQATALDERKWVITAGTPTVAGGECRLIYDGIQSRERFLYGVLSVTVWSSNWSNVAFGFGTSDYPQGGDSYVAVQNDTFVTQNVGVGVSTTTDIPAADLLGGVWYNIDLVWTPSFAQLWINGQLKVTHMTNIPSDPANIYFDAQKGILFVANASLKPYGDIPLVHRGAVPVAGGYYGTSGLLNMEFRPIAVCASGEVIICSGVHVISDVEVDVSSGLHVNISGQSIHLESGDTIDVFVKSGSEITATMSGQKIMLTDLSGHDAYIARTHHALVTTEAEMYEVHRGDMYSVSHCHSGLAAGATCDILMIPRSGYCMHTTFGCGLGDAYRAALYENPVCTNSGTPITAYCMNRCLCGTTEPPGSLFSAGPTVTNVGTELWCSFGGTPGGGHPAATPSAGMTTQKLEWMLNGISGTTTYLFRLLNRDTTAADGFQMVNFSEEVLD